MICLAVTWSAVSMATTAPAPRVLRAPAAGPVAVSGTVFEDVDADGTRDPGEPGLPGVQVTDGRTLTPTDGTGAYAVVVDPIDARFVVITVPRGYRSTTPFFAPLPSSGDQHVVDFGLVADGTHDPERLRFAHAADPQVADLAGADQMLAALTEIADLGAAADCVMLTGDLVQAARDDQFGAVATVLAASPIPVYPTFGDHDADDDSLRVRSYERWIGPTCYSFDRGPYHCVVWNDVVPVGADGERVQDTWLAADLAAASGTLLVFSHLLPDRATSDRLAELGVTATFSGHWHAHRARAIEGRLDLNTAPLRYAGIDRSSRGFRLVEVEGTTVRNTVRTGGVEAHLTVLHPAPSSSVPFGPLAVEAMAYDTRYPDLELDVTLRTAAGELVATGVMSHRGGWAYGLDGALPDLLPGDYALTVTCRAAGTLIATRAVDFEVAAVALPVAVDGAPWSTFRGNARGTGVATDAAVLPLGLAWVKYAGGPSGLSSPIVADGRVFVAHASGTGLDTTGGNGSAAGVAAFDTRSGTLIWRQATAGEVKGSPAVGDGRVVTISSDGVVEARDAASGSLLWSVALGDPAARFDVTSPTIDDGVVYTGGPGVTAAIDLASGDLLWQTSLAGSDFLATIYGAPVVDTTHVAIATYAGLHVLDRATGAILWSRAAGGRETHRSPALVDGVLYAAGDSFGSQRLRALDVATGAELWSAPYPVGNANSAPAVGATRVVLGTSNGQLQAFDRTSGALVWSHQVGEPIASGVPYGRDAASVTASPLITGDWLLAGGDDGRLLAIDVATGDVVWSGELGAPVRASAALTGNQVFVSTTDGLLVAYRAGAPHQVAIDDAGTMPPRIAVRLGTVWPNPVRSLGWIPFRVGGGDLDGGGTATRHAARLEIYDVAGRHVRTLLDAPLAAGEHRVAWDGRDARGREVGAGIYFVRLEAEGVRRHGRIAIVR
jgi:outer membrane protein assembly factor BamB